MNDINTYLTSCQLGYVPHTLQWVSEAFLPFSAVLISHSIVPIFSYSPWIISNIYNFDHGKNRKFKIVQEMKSPPSPMSSSFTFDRNDPKLRWIIHMSKGLHWHLQENNPIHFTIATLFFMCISQIICIKYEIGVGLPMPRFAITVIFPIPGLSEYKKS